MAHLATRSGSRDARLVEALFRLLLPVALTCFVATVVTDWAYAESATIEYSNFSAWILLFGLVSAGLAILLFGLSLIDGWLDGPRRFGGAALLLIGFAVEVVNFMIHNRDGWTTVVPTGLTLSVVGAVLFLAAAWTARTPVVVGERRA